MARGVNKVIAIGNLGRDPETREVNGTQVANFSVAVTESWKDRQTGEQKESTEWMNCQAWGALAGICGQYLHKGSKVYIEGKMQTRTYEKDGQKHYRTEVNVREMQMLDSKGAGQQQGGPASPADDLGFGDDVPFAPEISW